MQNYSFNWDKNHQALLISTLPFSLLLLLHVCPRLRFVLKHNKVKDDATHGLGKDSTPFIFSRGHEDVSALFGSVHPVIHGECSALTVRGRVSIH